MKDANTLLREVYLNSESVEICIAELKRKGFTKNETIYALMDILELDVAVADRFVENSLVWND